MTTLVCPLCRIALTPPEHHCPRDGSEGVPHAFEALPLALGGRFRVVMPFAGSETASSFVADSLGTGQRGLLKIYAKPRTARDPELLRIRRELDKQQRLSSPYLLVPWESGESEGTTWVFRRWLDGVSLAVVLARRKALPAREALGIGAQLAVALEALHAQGLLHRDLRPGHVFLEARAGGAPRVQVLDAGLPNVRQRTNGPPVVGTPGYSAPEQLLGRLVSMRSDLYSLGVLLAEMLSGTRLFGEAEPEAQLQAQLRGVRPTLSDTLAESVRGMVDALVTSDAQRRPFSAQKLRRTLDAYLVEGAPVTRQPTSTFSTPSGAPAQPGQPAYQPAQGAPAQGAKAPALSAPPMRPSGSPPPPPPAAASVRPPPATGRPATRAPLPPPPSRRADETQQLDEGLLEELLPSPPKAVPPAPPQRPNVPAKPARANEDYTVPVRLDQILAVSHTPRASAPPLPAPPSAQPPAVPAVIGAPAVNGAPAAAAPDSAQLPPAPAAPFAPTVLAAPAVTLQPPPAASLPALSTLPALGASPAKAPAPHAGTLFDSETHVDAAPPAASAAAVAPTVPVGPSPTALTDESQAPTRDFAAREFAPVEAHKRTALGMPSPLLDALVDSQDDDEDADDALSAAATQVASAPRRSEPADGSVPLTAASLTTSDLPRGDGLGHVPHTPVDAQDPDLSGAVTTMVATRSEPPLASLLEPDEARTPALAPLPVAPAHAGRNLAPDEITQPVRELQTSVRPASDEATRKYLVYGAAAAAALLLGFGARALLHGGSEPSAAVEPPADSAPSSTQAAAEPAAPSDAPKLAAIDDEAEPSPAPAAPAAAPVVAAAPSTPSVTALPSAPAPHSEPAPSEEPAVPDAPKTVADKHTGGSARSAKETRAEHHTSRDKASAAAKGKGEGGKESSQAQWSAARDEARAAFAAHNYRKAAEAYERATRANPSDPGTFAGLGAARLQLHDARGAVDAYQHAVQASPNTAGFHVMLARAYEASGDSVRARASYKRALALDPQNATVSAALAKLK